MSINQSLANTFISALEIEKHEDYETTYALLSSTPPKILARNGLALLNLVIENIRTRFNGRLVVELVPDNAIFGSNDSNSNKLKNKSSKSTNKSKLKSKSKINSKSQKSSSNNCNSNVGLSNNDFKPGDIVKIDKYPPASESELKKKLQNSSKNDDINDSVIESVTIKGVVTSSTNGKICVELSNTFKQGSPESTELGNLISDKVWDLQSSNTRIWLVKISNETTYRRMESTLRKLSEFSLDSISNLEYAPSIVQYLLGSKKFNNPSSTEISNLFTKLDFRNNKLNESQKQAISFALLSELTVIHGPPGTGKTSTIVEYIIQHLKLYPNKRILITAPSNIAADTIIERLSSYFESNISKLVRIGHPARILSSTKKHSLDYLINMNGGEELVDLQSDLSKLEKEVRKPRTSKKFVDRREIWNEIKLLKKEFRYRSRKSVQDILIGSKVVVSTLHGSGSWEIVGNLYNSDKFSSELKGFGKGFFHTVIIDEVSQALEPSCWIPIINHGPDKLVLAGDNKQLPPTIHVSNKNDDSKNKDAFRVLSRSLFDRIVNIYGGKEIEIPFIKFLDTQYRMCEKCMEFPSNEWYNGKLKAAESVKYSKVIDLVRDNKAKKIIAHQSNNKLKKRKKKNDNDETDINIEDLKIEGADNLEEVSDLVEQVVWIDTQGGTCPESIEESNDSSGKLLGIGGSKYNIGECYVVQKYVKQLLRLGVEEGDIGIIAPYNAQVARLRSIIWRGKLNEEDEDLEDLEEEGNSDGIGNEFPGIEISTVDGFQGREKEIIILSLVRSNFGHEKWGSSDVGFLSDFRRLNVSITRCKKQLAIIGDMETLEQSGIDMLKDWCSWCSENADIRYIE